MSENTTTRLGWLPLILAALTSGALYYLSTGLGTLWPLAWIAPLPVLVIVARVPWLVAALVAFGAFAVGTLNEVDYLWHITRGDLRSTIIAQTFETLSAATGFALVALIARLGMLRLHPSLAVFVFPAVWTAYEYAFSSNPLTGTLFSMASTQADFLPLVQLASLTGIWGMVFLVSLAPSALAIFWTNRNVWVAAPAMGLIAAALIFGVVRLQAPASGALIRVGLAASDADGDPRYPQDVESMRPVIARYAERIQRLASAGAKFVVLPEKIVGASSTDASQVAVAFAAAARTSHVAVIAGIAVVDDGKRRNLALAFGPDGQDLGAYQKHHLVFSAEGAYAPGEKISTLPLSGARWGVAICKDLDYPPWMRRYGPADVRLLAVPAWDFDVDGRLRARIAMLRGVENGYAVARASKQGRLTLSDAYGRVVAERLSGGGSEALVAGDLLPGPGETFYARFGDWFAWTSVALAVLALALVLFPAKGARWPFQQRLLS